MDPFANSETLSASQRDLVQQNIGLVAVHLQRRLPRERLRPDGPDRWDDLFQDGCLGLIRAARTFDARRGVPFAAHALANIHREIERAVRREGSSVHVPERQGREVRPSPSVRSKRRKQHPFRRRGVAPRVFARAPEALDGLSAPVCPRRPAETSNEADGVSPDAGRSLGELIHAKIHAAAAVALAAITPRPKRKYDRLALARRLVEERILVPEEQARATLRDIAERSGTSYGRAVACEEELRLHMRRILDAEAEFEMCVTLRGSSPSGEDRTADAGLLAKLGAVSGQQAFGLFRAASRGKQAALLLTVAEGLRLDLSALFNAYAARLDAAARTAWVADALDLPSASGR